MAGVSSYLTDAKKAFEKAQKEYTDAASSSTANSDRKTDIAKEIEAVNVKITAKQQEVDTLKATLESSPIKWD